MLKNFKILWHSYKPIVETNSSISNTILIAGSARSGTTWLGSVCAKMIKAREIFEPFLLDEKGNFSLLFYRYLDVRKKMRTNYSLYLSSTMQIDRNIVYQVKKILQGKIRSYWTDRYTTIGIYSKRIIKDIRCNLLLDFLAHKWPEMKIIWIVRNPIKVIQSQLYLSMKYGWKFDFDDRVLLQKQLVKDYLSPFINIIKKSKTLPEKLMHRWCIENFVPFNQNLKNLPNVLIVHYDKLISSKDEWNKVKLFLNASFWDDKKLDIYINIPSRTYIKKDSLDIKNILKYFSFSEKKLLNIIKFYELECFLI